MPLYEITKNGRVLLGEETRIQQEIKRSHDFDDEMENAPNEYEKKYNHSRINAIEEKF